MPTEPDPEYERLVDGFVVHIGPTLVIGSAGSGKTSAALRKAAWEIDRGLKFRHSKVLFMSFANSTIERVVERAEKIISSEQRKQLEVSTYHGFAWSIVRSHSYLLSAPHSVSILSPGEENAFRSALADPNADVDAEFRRLFTNFGQASFDLFATLAAEILESDPRLAKAYADAYPVIFLDEFQDTTDSQWRLMRALGAHSVLSALGDSEQRIYGHIRGASEARFEELTAEYHPLVVDLSAWNWRSPEGSITKFGKDLLQGELDEKYEAVYFVGTKFPPLFYLKSAVMAGMKRLRSSKGTIAILTPSNRLSGLVYDYFVSETPPLPALRMDIHAGKDAAYAASFFIAEALALDRDDDASVARLSRSLAHYLRTRSQAFTKTAMQTAAKLEREALRLEAGGGTDLKSTLGLRGFLSSSITRGRTGHPYADYLAIVSAAGNNTDKLISSVASNARLIQIVKPGNELDSALSGEWRQMGGYPNASEHMRRAVLGYQMFSTKAAARDLIVMTIHRSKGKEFDEVFVYEDEYNRFVRDDADDLMPARLAMNVAVTRARQRATILSPAKNPTRLLA